MRELKSFFRAFSVELWKLSSPTTFYFTYRWKMTENDSESFVHLLWKLHDDIASRLTTLDNFSLEFLSFKAVNKTFEKVFKLSPHILQQASLVARNSPEQVVSNRVAFSPSEGSTALDSRQWKAKQVEILWWFCKKVWFCCQFATIISLANINTNQR